MWEESRKFVKCTQNHSNALKIRFLSIFSVFFHTGIECSFGTICHDEAGFLFRVPVHPCPHPGSPNKVGFLKWKVRPGRSDKKRMC